MKRVKGTYKRKSKRKGRGAQTLQIGKDHVPSLCGNTVKSTQKKSKSVPKRE